MSVLAITGNQLNLIILFVILRNFTLTAGIFGDRLMGAHCRIHIVLLFVAAFINI